MAAIPYLWYWIIGSLVAVLIATVAIFSERNIPGVIENQTVFSEKEADDVSDKNQSVADQQNDGVTEPTNIDQKTENNSDINNQEVLSEKATVYSPSLQTVRIDNDGTALVAGTAYPGSTLEILIDDKVVETITMGRDGNFAVLFDIELKDQPQVISIRSIDDEIILTSEETMIVLPNTVELASEGSVSDQVKNENQPLASGQIKQSNGNSTEDGAEVEMVAEAASKIETSGSSKTTSNEDVQDNLNSKVPQLPKPTEEIIVSSNIGTEQTTVLLSDNEGVKVVQGDIGPSIMTEVLFDTVNYSKDGSVAVQGRGRPEAIVHFYLDNFPVASTSVDQQGYWSADLSDVKAGIYTLRLDQVDKSGKVSSRVESPFKREDRKVLADQIKDTASPARINVLTVQPGNTLWAISRERYGRGILYVQVFDANKDKIRDPDLIYPGQIFDLPDDITAN